MQQLSAEKLNAFFQQLTKPTLSKDLPMFFEKLALALEEDRANTQFMPEHKLFDIDANQLDRFFKNLEQPLQIAKQSGWLCDPWQVAGLKRDEVRNSKVLSWLLNPHGSHGFGDALLLALLKEINSCLVKNEQSTFDLKVSNNCRVKEEQCPDGNQGNRVDIEIDDANFYLIIEVKVDAYEQNSQLERYANLAQKRANNRPWSIVYITVSGKQPLTAGDYIDKVLSISWKQLAHILSDALPKKEVTEPHAMVTALLANSFFRHIRQF